MAFTPSTKSPEAKLGLVAGARLLRHGDEPALALPPQVVRVRRKADVVLVTVTSVTELERVLEGALGARSDSGRLWLCYAKRGPVSRAQIGAVLERTPAALTWFRQVALPDGWSAIWVKRRSEFKVLNR